jgi:biotin carboxyl carrier protein
MVKVEITVPKSATPKTGAYACECQKVEIKLVGKEAKVFWVAKLNDRVKCGEVLCKLEVQKTTVEIPSPCDGRLVDICIEDGSICSAGSILGYLAKEAN